MKILHAITKKFLRIYSLFAIRKKYLKEQNLLPFMDYNKELYYLCHQKYYSKLLSFPDLLNPLSYNEKIQWLKLFNQDTKTIFCSDKHTVRRYVEKVAGKQYLTKIYQVCDKFDDIEFERLPTSFVIKTNHDSGSVFLVKDKRLLEYKKIKKLFNKSLSKKYGWRNGEWNYSFIKKKIIVEEYLAPDADTPPPDYKFHCSNGKIIFLHYISDRGFGTKEKLYDADCNVIPLHLDSNLKPSDKVIAKPANWNELVKVASKLSYGFKYIRIDLYNLDGKIKFGEMTFFPKCGCYKGKDQKEIGELFELDTSSVKTPIYLNDNSNYDRHIPEYQPES